MLSGYRIGIIRVAQKGDESRLPEVSIIPRCSINRKLAQSVTPQRWSSGSAYREAASLN